MSLVDGLRPPTPHCAGSWTASCPLVRSPLRDHCRAQHRAQHVLLPSAGVGTEVGTVGTAIDQRLRLAFTAAVPVDDASLIGIGLSGGIGGRSAGFGCASPETNSRCA
ncbi:hypothetical protein AB0I75_35670 [Streptomyces sp. NPDC050273]|uniref:hypothetical protein n=1 Tax=Streptomyces sp. NPDC050273 TaxID=3154933 RepID=UPI003433D1DB